MLKAVPVSSRFCCAFGGSDVYSGSCFFLSFFLFFFSFFFFFFFFFVAAMFIAVPVSS